MGNLVNGVPDPALAELTVGDVEIGAVEIKDATTSARAVVDATYGLAVDIKRNAALVAGTAVIGHVITDTGSTTAVTGTVTVDTELLAAAVLADATANPTITQIAAYLMGYNGTTFDRVRLDASKNLVTTLASGANKVDIGGQASSDGNSSGLNTLVVAGFNYGFNGTTWDRLRSIAGSLGVPVTPYSGKTTNYITTATTTAVKASAGVVGTISNGGNAITGVITVYDSLAASGNKIWSGTLAAGQILPFGIPCATGITVVTAAADTIAVSFA